MPSTTTSLPRPQPPLAKMQPNAARSLGLPERYFLFAGRLVREKGVFELLSAYAKLDESMRQQVGSGVRGRRRVSAATGGAGGLAFRRE